jgi:hypothetical protein
VGCINCKLVKEYVCEKKECGNSIVEDGEECDSGADTETCVKCKKV